MNTAKDTADSTLQLFAITITMETPDRWQRRDTADTTAAVFLGESVS